MWQRAAAEPPPAQRVGHTPVKARGLGAVSQHTGSLPMTAAFDIANLPYPLEMAKSVTNISGSEQRVQLTFASADP
jgi:hypothetical protein